MQFRWLKGSFLILAGLALILGGIWINMAGDRTYWQLRLIGLGGILLIGGLWILIRGELPAFEIDRHWNARFGLYALSALCLFGTVLLTALAIRTPDDRGMKLLIAAGILIVGIGSLLLVRRLRG